MLLEKLSLKNFRNYKERIFSFAPGVNLLYGENGVGKTSVLEAIYLLSTGKSFRSPSLDPLIRKGAESLLIQAIFRKEEQAYRLNFLYNGKEKKVTLQGTPLTRYADLLGLFPSVLYSTQDHQLIAGSPSERRRFLNIILGQTDPDYVTHFIRFMRCLKQRNTLLKGKNLTALSPFEVMLARSGRYIMKKRWELTQFLQQRAKEHAKHLTAYDEEYSLSYQSSVPFVNDPAALEEALKKQWHEDLDKDALYGSTSSGPHRDDVSLLFNGKSAKQFASEGQKRTLLSAMKFAEYDFIREKFGKAPLFSIDDFTVHLDPDRINKLTSELTGSSQVFLTAPSHIPLKGNIINIDATETASV